ncbi:MAG: hypothetical protein JXQ87_05405 [Bacteroidia bacterium]
MKIAKIILISFFSFLGLFLLVFGIPIMNPTPARCNVVSGTMHQFKVHSGTKDINLRLIDDKGRYYINRGLENGINADIMRRLKDQEIRVWYAKHWSLLNYNGLGRHVCKISLNGETIYTEFRNENDYSSLR